MSIPVLILLIDEFC